MAKTEFVKAFEKVEQIAHNLQDAVSELKYEMEQQLYKAEQKAVKRATAGGK
ncbi:MAG: hypothetical protein WA510_03635 [Acidobacteriaceae bacterium]